MNQIRGGGAWGWSRSPEEKVPPVVSKRRCLYLASADFSFGVNNADYGACPFKSQSSGGFSSILIELLCLPPVT